MKPISNTTIPAFKLKNEGGEASATFRAQEHKIGWIHTKADTIGGSFDIVFRDALGREMLRKVNCHSETAEYGELMNIDTRMGEEMTVSLENIKNANEIELYLN